MKRTILLATMFACLAYGKISAQTVNGVRLADLKEDYLEASTFERTFSEKQFIFLEYGQKVRNDFDAGIVMDDKGKPMPFNSLIDFVNQMKEYGYEVFDVYAVYNEGDRTKKFFILKRKQ